MRDERVERRQADRARESARSSKRSSRDGEAALEGVAVEMGHAGERVAPRAEAEVARRVGREVAGPVAEVRAR